VFEIPVSCSIRGRRGHHSCLRNRTRKLHSSKIPCQYWQSSLTDPSIPSAQVVFTLERFCGVRRRPRRRSHAPGKPCDGATGFPRFPSRPYQQLASLHVFSRARRSASFSPDNSQGVRGRISQSRRKIFESFYPRGWRKRPRLTKGADIAILEGQWRSHMSNCEPRVQGYPDLRIARPCIECGHNAARMPICREGDDDEDLRLPG